jgi:hypothetical protein
MVKMLFYLFAGIAITFFLFGAYSDRRILPFVGLFMISAAILYRRISKKNE